MSSKGTGKIIPVLALKAYVGVEIQFHSLLTSALDGGECHSHFMPREIAPSVGIARFFGSIVINHNGHP